MFHPHKLNRSMSTPPSPHIVTRAQMIENQNTLRPHITQITPPMLFPLPPMLQHTHLFQAEAGMRDPSVTGVQTCALPICDRVGLSLRERGGGGGAGVAILPRAIWM